MLKHRVWTALVLIPLALMAIFLFNTFLFGLVMAGLMLLAAWEWLSLACHGKHTDFQTIYVIVLASCLWLSSQLLPPLFVLALGCLWWLFASVLVLTYPKTNVLWKKTFLVPAAIGLLVFISAWQGLVLVKDSGVVVGLSEVNGAAWLFYFFLLIWGADIGAYFIGKRYGKTPLLPLVSPGKTQEGLWAAMGVAVLLGVMGAFIFDKSLLGMILLALVTVLMSVVGDLTESVLKREAGVKESGWIFPGHGGVLDRIDSLLAAAPFFALGFLWLN